MASVKVNVECRLRWYARWLLIVAALLARIALRIPHGWIVAVTNKSWLMRLDKGKWRRITINNAGRIVN
jgi:hypothetical protein